MLSVSARDVMSVIRIEVNPLNGSYYFVAPLLLLHVYLFVFTPGNCTWPMEKTKCPADGCGALIGGQNHEAVSGVTRLGTGDEIGDKTSTRVRGRLYLVK